ncbi:MAG: AAA family ATPase [Phycisphaeraceae bacterium]|nr:AAA family ATPase [Phycisphaeraceae bacterium]
MRRKLDKLTIKGFKSIEALEDFELGSVNILIGANGAGKSNFVEFFRLLRAMVEERLQGYLLENGPADGFFFNGVGYTKTIEAELMFGVNGYKFSLKPTATGKAIIGYESTVFHGDFGVSERTIGTDVEESQLKRRRNETGATAQHGPSYYVWGAVSNWHVYHFHDTSITANMRRDSGIEQRDRLRPDGDNLAAFLLGLREGHPAVYQGIRKTIQRVAPYFDDFVFSVSTGKAEDQVRLKWKQKDKDYIFSPGHLSDGTIRFICLATALLQPSPPSTIVIDEPELGLHPEALAILAGLLRSASTRTQIIAATQSPLLLSEFEPDQVITVDQVDGASQFRRLDAEALETWLDEFSLGELWLKGNVRGGVNDA